MKSSEMKERYPWLWQELFGEEGMSREQLDTSRLESACEKVMRKPQPEPAPKREDAVKLLVSAFKQK
jgi:hypothetical protein